MLSRPTSRARGVAAAAPVGVRRRQARVSPSVGWRTRRRGPGRPNGTVHRGGSAGECSSTRTSAMSTRCRARSVQLRNAAHGSPPSAAPPQVPRRSRCRPRLAGVRAGRRGVATAGTSSCATRHLVRTAPQSLPQALPRGCASRSAPSPSAVRPRTSRPRSPARHARVATGSDPARRPRWPLPMRAWRRRARRTRGPLSRPVATWSTLEELPRRRRRRRRWSSPLRSGTGRPVSRRPSWAGPAQVPSVRCASAHGTPRVRTAARPNYIASRRASGLGRHSAVIAVSRATGDAPLAASRGPRGT